MAIICIHKKNCQQLKKVEVEKEKIRADNKWTISFFSGMLQKKSMDKIHMM